MRTKLSFCPVFSICFLRKRITYKPQSKRKVYFLRILDPLKSSFHCWKGQALILLQPGIQICFSIKCFPHFGDAEAIISPLRGAVVKCFTRANTACNQLFFRYLEFDMEAWATPQENGKEFGIGFSTCLLDPFPSNLDSSQYQLPCH